MPYVCEGTMIRTNRNREGMVIGVDRENKIVLVRAGSTSFTERLENVSVVSYKGVE